MLNIIPYCVGSSGAVWECKNVCCAEQIFLLENLFLFSLESWTFVITQAELSFLEMCCILHSLRLLELSCISMLQLHVQPVSPAWTVWVQVPWTFYLSAPELSCCVMLKWLLVVMPELTSTLCLLNFLFVLSWTYYICVLMILADKEFMSGSFQLPAAIDRFYYTLMRIKEEDPVA